MNVRVQLLTVYDSHLLGHEAEGSLLSYYKERGWANGSNIFHFDVISSNISFALSYLGLASYSNTGFRGFATAGVSIELTDEGSVSVTKHE